MTKAQIKEALQQIINEVMEEHTNNTYDNDIRNISESVNGSRWCNNFSNLQEITEKAPNTAEQSKAERLVRQACELDGKVNLVSELAKIINNI